MDTISPSQPIEKAQLDALAEYANTKTRLAGQPYAFSSSGWLTELNRLRQNILIIPLNTISTQFGELADSDYYHLTRWQNIDSRKMLLQFGSPYISFTGLRSADAPVLSNKNLSTDPVNRRYYRPASLFSSNRDLEYWFAAPDVIVDNSVTTTLELRRGYIWGDTPDEIGSDATPQLSSLNQTTWTLSVTVPEGSRCQLSTECARIFGTFANAASYPTPSITATGIHNGEMAVSVVFVPTGGSPVGRGYWAVRLEADFIFEGNMFQIGIRLNDYAPPGSPVPRYFDTAVGSSFFLSTQNYLRFSFVTEAEESPALHGTRATYKVTFPESRLNFSDESESVGADLKMRNGLLQYSGNLGFITHTAHESIADGLFIGKTIPIRSAYVNPAIGADRILNPTADAPEMQYLIPAYPFRHISETKPDEGESLIRVGTIIYKVNIWKAPVLNGEIYDYAPRQGGGDVCTIGYMRGAEFIELEQVIFDKVNEMEIYPDWPILEAGVKLVYQTESGNRMNLVANIIDPTLNTFVLGSFFPTTPYAALPIIYDHYNDTVEMLNQLT